MPNMICQRNFTLRTTTGHMLKFEAGKSKYVPPECVDAALAVNIIMEEGGFKPRSEVDVVGPVRVAAMSSELREALLLHSIDELVRDGETTHFDAGSRPKTESIKNHANLNLNATERNRLWDKYRDIKGSNSDLPRPRNFDLVLEVQQSATHKQLMDQATNFGIKADDVRGFTLRELKACVVQAAIKHNPMLMEAPAGLDTTLDDDVDA